MTQRSVRALLFFFLVCSLLSAKVGEVVEVSGKADYTTDGVKWKEVFKGLEITDSTTLRTGYTGMVKVKLLDGSALLVRTRTTVKFADFVVKDEEEKGLVKLLYGKLRMWVAKAGKKRKDIRVETRTATIGVKGTDFSLLAERNVTRVVTHEGVVSLISKLTGEEVLVEAGFQGIAGSFGLEVLPAASEDGVEPVGMRRSPDVDVSDFSFNSPELPLSAERVNPRETRNGGEENVEDDASTDASSAVSEVESRLVEIEVRVEL